MPGLLIINNWSEQGQGMTGSKDGLTGHVLRWSIRYLNWKNFFFDSSPIVMVKSPFDLINGIAVVRVNERKSVSATCQTVIKYLDCELTSRSSPSWSQTLGLIPLISSSSSFAMLVWVQERGAAESQSNMESALGAQITCAWSDIAIIRVDLVWHQDSSIHNPLKWLQWWVRGWNSMALYCSNYRQAEVASELEGGAEDNYKILIPVSTCKRALALVGCADLSLDFCQRRPNTKRVYSRHFQVTSFITERYELWKSRLLM